MARLEGEVSDHIRRKIDLHLEECWSCRARSAQFAETIVNLATAANSEAILTPEQLEHARLRFQEAYTALGSEKRKRSWFFRWNIAAVGAALVVLAAVVLWMRQRPVGPSPWDLLASTSKAEQSLSSGASLVHQTFHIQITGDHNDPQPLTKKLNVWSEAKTGRFTSRLERSGGVLEQAVWVSDRNHAYRYDFVNSSDSSTSLSEVGLVHEVARSGMSAGEVEAAFVHWVQGRPWKPISLSSEMASFVSSDGALLSAERVTSHGVPVLQFTARKMMGGVTAVMTLQVDEGPFRVRAANLRLERQEHPIEIRFIPEVNESLQTVSFANVLFEPDRKLLQFVIPLNGSPPVRRDIKPVASPLPENPSPQRILVEKIELDFALHRIGACVGEQIEVLRSRSGLSVIGMARSAARKSEWLAALNSSQLPAWVHLDLRTPDEVLKQTRDQDSPPTIAPAPPVSVQLLDSSRFLVEDAVDQYLKAGGVEGPPSHFAESSLNKTETILAEAAALNHLVTVGEQTELASLPLSSRVLIQTMVSDHLSALQRLTSGLREQVSPALSPLVERVDHSANRRPGDLTDRVPWTSAAPAIALDTQRLYRAATVLFGPKSGQTAVTSREIGQTVVQKEVIDFFETLQRVEDRTRTAARDLKTFSSARN